MKYLAPIPKQFVDQNGLPLSDGTVHVYISGDTASPSNIPCHHSSHTWGRYMSPTFSTRFGSFRISQFISPLPPIANLYLVHIAPATGRLPVAEVC